MGEKKKRKEKGKKSQAKTQKDVKQEQRYLTGRDEKVKK